MDRDTLLRTPVDRQALRQHTERWFGRLPDLKDPELPPDLEWQLRAEIVAQVQSDPGDLLETLAGNLDDVATYLNGGSVPNVRFLDRSHGRLHTIQSAPDPQLYGPQWLCSWWKTFFFTFTFLGILLAMSGAGAVLGGINLFVAQFFNLLTWLGGC